MRYRTQIVATGKNTAGIPVPDDVIERLGGARRPAVTVTLNGHTYRSTVATVSGAAMISFSAENRALAGVAAGEEVDVDLELDTRPRTIEAPDDLEAALAAEPAARRTWDALSYSKQRWHVLSVEGAKAPATRQRRIEASIAALREGRDR